MAKMTLASVEEEIPMEVTPSLENVSSMGEVVVESLPSLSEVVSVSVGFPLEGFPMEFNPPHEAGEPRLGDDIEEVTGVRRDAKLPRLIPVVEITRLLSRRDVEMLALR